MSAANADGAEIYELIQRLVKLHEAQYAFRYRLEQERHAAMERERERERRYREEECRVQQEAAETVKKIREKLGVPEPARGPDAAAPATAFDLNVLFGDFFAQFGMKPSSEPPLK